ncbi:hypothetical protein [Agromyces indicus]|uniref:DUF222 domain-containing protein n=1 Tax=Agromyces indicus TaxID=758919 RepID=A0ABU1FK09_9MICO|nr:hypothetical protein [Agromyces indicus]MDR5692098.1 hypothetical protein [Agromyces indicus]
MIDTASNINLVTTALKEALALTRLQDRNLTPEGIQARQRHEWRGIQARLTAALPAEPTLPDRQPVLDALAPHTADQIARVQHGQTKVAALLAADRTLPEVIATADRDRLATILDGLETLPDVLESRDPGSVTAALESMIWDRLVEVDEDAKKVAAAEAATLPARAWRTILEGVATTGEVPFDGLALLHQADPAAFELLVDGTAQAAPAPESGSIPRLLESLEQVSVTV